MPSSKTNPDYEAFSKAFVKAHEGLQKQLLWQNLKSTWVEIKPIKGDKDKFNQKMSELELKAKSEKTKKMSYWVNLQQKQTKLNKNAAEKEPKEVEKPSQSFQEMEVDSTNENKETLSSQEPAHISAFSQDFLHFLVMPKFWGYLTEYCKIRQILQ